MAPHPLQALVRHARRLAGAPEPAPHADAELLGRFAATRDESAFAEIVQRHGPLVWAICRTNLGAADADDAFQATFLVLARRAKSIRKPASLACWLSGVVRRTVQSVRARSVRRREVAIDADIVAETSADAELNEQRAVIAQELDRLPDKYRLPTMLCYYQGLTNEEAAQRLGWPHGTVCGRLARARDLLRTKLARRGVMLSAGTLVTSAAGPPAELLAATLKTSMATTLKGSTLQLAEAVMHAMWLTKIKIAVGAGLLVAALGTGTGWVLAPAKAQDTKKGPVATVAVLPQVEQPFDPSKFDEKSALELLRSALEATKPSPLADKNPADDAIRELVKEKHRTAIRELSLRLQVFQAGARGGTIDVLLEAVRRGIESEIALSSRPNDVVAARKRSVQLAQAIVAVNWVRYQVGQVAGQDFEQSRYYMLDAQIKLAEAEPKAGAGK